MIQTRKHLTISEACDYLGYKKSYLYKLTSSGILPHSKPNGGRMFFDPQKLDEWVSKNQSSTSAEREVAASTYVTTNT